MCWTYEFDSKAIYLGVQYKTYQLNISFCMEFRKNRKTDRFII